MFSHSTLTPPVRKAFLAHLPLPPWVAPWMDGTFSSSAGLPSAHRFRLPNCCRYFPKTFWRQRRDWERPRPKQLLLIAEHRPIKSSSFQQLALMGLRHQLGLEFCLINSKNICILGLILYIRKPWLACIDANCEKPSQNFLAQSWASTCSRWVSQRPVELSFRKNLLISFKQKNMISSSSSPEISWSQGKKLQINETDICWTHRKFLFGSLAIPPPCLGRNVLAIHSKQRCRIPCPQLMRENPYFESCPFST